MAPTRITASKRGLRSIGSHSRGRQADKHTNAAGAYRGSLERIGDVVNTTDRFDTVDGTNATIVQNTMVDDNIIKTKTKTKTKAKPNKVVKPKSKANSRKSKANNEKGKTSRANSWTEQQQRVLIYNYYFTREKITHSQTADELNRVGRVPRTALAVRIELCRLRNSTEALQPLFDHWWSQGMKHTKLLPGGVRVRDAETMEGVNNLLIFFSNARFHPPKASTESGAASSSSAWKGKARATSVESDIEPPARPRCGRMSASKRPNYFLTPESSEAGSSSSAAMNEASASSAEPNNDPPARPKCGRMSASGFQSHKWTPKSFAAASSSSAATDAAASSAEPSNDPPARPKRVRTPSSKLPNYIFLTPEPYRSINMNSFNDQGIARVRAKKAGSV